MKFGKICLKQEKKMNQAALRALIRNILLEEVGEVTVSRGNRSSSGSGGGGMFSAVSSFLFGDADESNFDEEILDEDEAEECSD